MENPLADNRYDNPGWQNPGYKITILKRRRNAITRLSKKVICLVHRLNNLGSEFRLTLFPSLFNREGFNV